MDFCFRNKKSFQAKWNAFLLQHHMSYWKHALILHHTSNVIKPARVSVSKTLPRTNLIKPYLNSEMSKHISYYQYTGQDQLEQSDIPIKLIRHDYKAYIISLYPNYSQFAIDPRSSEFSLLLQVLTSMCKMTNIILESSVKYLYYSSNCL